MYALKCEILKNIEIQTKKFKLHNDYMKAQESGNHCHSITLPFMTSRLE